MRPGSVKLIPIAIALIFMLSACKKKDDNPPAFTHRIISEKGYLNDQLDYNETYEYSGDKVSRLYIVGTNWSTEDLFTYPDATRININYNKTYGQNVYIGINNIILSNNKVAEIRWADDEKTTFSYTSDGKIEKIKDYSYDAAWILSYEGTRTYSSGKLVEETQIDYVSVPNNEDKWVLTYTGEEIKDQIYSARQSGGTWTEKNKYTYTYGAGKVSNITSYNKNGIVWEIYWSRDFVYDVNGNLIRMTEASYGDTYRIDYTYEEKIGNYYKILEYLAYDNFYMYPNPNKKSQSTVRDLSGVRKIPFRKVTY